MTRIFALIGVVATIRAYAKHDRFWRQARMW